MMKIALRFATFALVALAATLLLGAPALASGIRAYVDGPMVVGDQVFGGGTVELERVGGSLVAIRINGRQVALAFRQTTSGGLPDGRASILLRRDERGFHHLVGLRVASSGSDIHLGVAAVVKGVATLPHAAGVRGEGVARAAR